MLKMMTRLASRRRARAAARGAMLLDRKMPGWWLDVRPERLDQSNTYRCVCGQLAGKFSSWEITLERLKMPYALTARYGFRLTFATLLTTGRVTDRAYDELTEFWREQVTRRRLRDAKVPLDRDAVIGTLGGTP
jgi:hypothetical protein